MERRSGHGLGPGKVADWLSHSVRMCYLVHAKSSFLCNSGLPVPLCHQELEQVHRCQPQPATGHLAQRAVTVAPRALHMGTTWHEGDKLQDASRVEILLLTAHGRVFLRVRRASEKASSAEPREGGFFFWRGGDSLKACPPYQAQGRHSHI